MPHPPCSALATSPERPWAGGLSRVLVIGALALALPGLPAAVPSAMAQQNASQEVVNGPACVTDAGHLTLNGRRSYGACRGGTAITLADIEAPVVSQTCTTPDGEPWKCGRWAAYVLLELTKDQTVMCHGTRKDDGGRLIATCSAGGREINRTMVELGWALAAPMAVQYQSAMDKARRNRLGLWQGTFERPAEWARRHAE